jgi:coenzyme Q-binding protein COQ10
MPKLCKTVTAPYTQAQLFNLVADVAKYPEFLPFCTGVHIYENSDDHMLADLQIGYKGFSGAFQSKVYKTFPQSLTMEQTHGSLKYLHSAWMFKKTPTLVPQVEINFTIDFEPLSWIVGKLIRPILSEMGDMMMEAFLDRARTLYITKYP